MKISSVRAYEILASGGYPSIEVQIGLDDGSTGVASVPYGASAGSHEAAVLTDGDSSRWNGQGMLRAIDNINSKITPRILSLNPEDQRAIDNTMIEIDGTNNKANLGGNAILAVSIAVANAVANAKKVPLYHHIMDHFQTHPDLSTLPQPMVVVIEGGKHADDSTDLQEFCFSAVRQSSAKENIRMILECYHQLHKILQEQGLSTNVGNEGAFAPSGISTNEAPFKFMLEAIAKAGYQAGKDVSISVDAAASEFYQDGQYHLKLENRTLTAEELIAYYRQWFEKYPIVTFEDGLDEDDWDNWPKLLEVTKAHHVELIGDDLTVTNPHRLQTAIDRHAISAILIKLNQIGTLTETVDTCMMAKQHGLSTTTSHRGGGETNDATMIDVAVAVGSRFVKVGPTRGERVSKYNRLMAIERELGR